MQQFWYSKCTCKMNWQGIIFLVSHHNLLCIFYMTSIQDIFCVAVFLHRSVQNLVWNICLLTESANQIWRGELVPDWHTLWKDIKVKITNVHISISMWYQTENCSSLQPAKDFTVWIWFENNLPLLRPTYFWYLFVQHLAGFILFSSYYY